MSIRCRFIAVASTFTMPNPTKPVEMSGFWLLRLGVLLLQPLLVLVTYSLAVRLAVKLRVQVFASLIGGLLDLWLDRMGPGVGVFAYAGHLPGDFHIGLVGLDSEAVVLDF